MENIWPRSKKLPEVVWPRAVCKIKDKYFFRIRNDQKQNQCKMILDYSAYPRQRKRKNALYSSRIVFLR